MYQILIKHYCIIKCEGMVREQGPVLRKVMRVSINKSQSNLKSKKCLPLYY
jgi:hypothetical protein